MEDIQNLLLIENIQLGINTKDNLEHLYCKYLNFIYFMSHKLGVKYSTLDDFKQQAYLALVQATRSYNCASGYSFSYYYSKFLQHQYYDYYLKMCFPIKISHSFYKEHKKRGHYLLESNFPIDYFKEDLSNEIFPFEEYSILKIELWGTVSENVTNLNFYIIQQRFVYERTLEDIGNELNIGKDRVRLRILRSLNKLRNNRTIRELAHSYFNLL